MQIVYSSNNIGGGWWLNDKDWKNLEKEGWHVIWGGKCFCHSGYNPMPKDKNICPTSEDCRGHRKFNSWKDMKKKDRWLDCLAKEAYKDFSSMQEGIGEWESVTGRDYEEEGCSCCGSPHYFYKR